MHATGAFVPQPNLYRVVVGPLFKEHMCSCHGVDERVDFDILAGSGAILRVKKTEAVEHSFNLSAVSTIHGLCRNLHKEVINSLYGAIA